MRCNNTFARSLRIKPLVVFRLLSQLARGLLLAVLLFPVSSLIAGEGLVYVDIPYLIENAPQAQAASKNLSEEFHRREQEIEKKRAELEGLKTTIAFKGVQSKAEDLNALTESYRSLARDLRQDEIEFRDALNIRKNSEFKRIRGLVLDAVSRFGKLNHYDMIVSDGVLYVDRSVNVTDRILQNLINQADSEVGLQ